MNVLKIISITVLATLPLTAISKDENHKCSGVLTIEFWSFSPRQFHLAVFYEQKGRTKYSSSVILCSISK